MKINSHKAYRVDLNFSYLIIYNYCAGRKNVYDVHVHNADDPVVTGQELNMKNIKQLINDYENMIMKTLRFYSGNRKDVLKVMKKVNKLNATKV